MFQGFDATTRPQDGPPRLALLRATMQAQGLTGFMVPRADAYQGEYVAPCDERLAWLTGFTGSAGFCIVLPDRAGLFVDGRYRVQARTQCAPDFTPVPWPETRPGPWLRDILPDGGVIGFDPWLHTADEIAQLDKALQGSTVTLRRCTNLIDPIWTDRPAPPTAPAFVYPDALSGETSGAKRARIAQKLRDAGQRAAVLTQPESLCWLLNLRGADLPRVPVVQGFAILHDDGRVHLFAAPHKFDALAQGPDLTLRPPEAFEPALRTLQGPVRLDKATAPLHLADILTEAGVEIAWMQDPVALPRACKNVVEQNGARAAHLRDGAAMVEFLCWLDGRAERVATDPDFSLTEIDIVRQLETCRAETGKLHDISFDTISGSGPNGAIVHYRVTSATNRRLVPGDLMLVDSGGQYMDGTTDITRTIAIGHVPYDACACFTRVLQGLIAMSTVRFPRGVAGAHLDALARAPLWRVGLDYDHGTGHGVGAFLSVHEGPQRLSRISQTPLQTGMILSIEPGHYREGAFGIRIENLAIVQDGAPLPGGDARDWLLFETLTLCPIDRRLIVTDLLSADERAWVDAYHVRVLGALSPLVSEVARDWLTQACAPLSE